MNESRVIRDRQQQTTDEIERLGAVAVPGSISLVCTTVTVTTYPTSSGRYFGVQSYLVTGTPAEGASATLTVSPYTFYALHVGSTIPASGTTVLVEEVGGRWAFQY